MFKAKKPRDASTHAPRLSLGTREAISGYAMITPMAIGYLIFMVVPIFIMFWLSMTNYSLFGKAKFIGFENSKTDARFNPQKYVCITSYSIVTLY